jgi:protein-disulfide isomerase
MIWLRWAARRLAPAGFLAFAAAAGPAGAASDAEVAAALMQPAPLPDIVEGVPDAPATIVEYASLTCTHCAIFHLDVWPALKAKYVDTGKAKFILREFPLDALAVAAFMAARCVGPDKRDAMVDRLFDQMGEWAFKDQPIERLRRETGLSPADFLACVKDKGLFDGVSAERDAAAKQFGIDSTPTFFVNGRRLAGEPALAAFDAALAEPAK